MRSTAARKIIDFRALRIRGAVVLGHYRYTEAHSQSIPHRRRNTLEICYLARGEQTHRVGQQDFNLHGGDVLLTFPNEHHSTGRLAEQRGELYWLLLDMSPNSDLFLGCEKPESRLLRTSLLRMHPRHFKGSPLIKAIFEDLVAIYSNREFGFRRTALRIALVRLLLEILDCCRRWPKPPNPSPGIQAVQSFIHAHLVGKESLHLAELAARAGMSLSSFKARFLSEVGVPPAEYVTRRKIEHAARLLAAGHAVTHVAFELGFCSSQHFATVFRRYTGQNPGKLKPRKISRARHQGSRRHVAGTSAASGRYHLCEARSRSRRSSGSKLAEDAKSR